MPLLETCFFRGRKVEVALHDDLRYRLAWGDEVVYENGEKRVRGRRAPYRFRSVEQLRYDFEQDVKALGGRLG
ncbi:MAG TPA: hypothetical protein VG873_01920 [Burkholderiales bacterium]|nr:hypothetical protein [Burkholderiales bacterium]